MTARTYPERSNRARVAAQSALYSHIQPARSFFCELLTYNQYIPQLKCRFHQTTFPSADCMQLPFKHSHTKQRYCALLTQQHEHGEATR